jgi:hypothetical protein
MFTVQHDKILTPGAGTINFWGLADQNAQSIKSLEGVTVCWIEEPLSYYVNELRAKGYSQARCVLPHDGVNRNVIPASVTRTICGMLAFRLR